MNLKRGKATSPRAVPLGSVSSWTTSTAAARLPLRHLGHRARLVVAVVAAEPVGVVRRRRRIFVRSHSALGSLRLRRGDVSRPKAWWFGNAGSAARAARFRAARAHD